MILSDSLRGRSNSGPQIGALFGDRASDGRALHFAFVVYYHSGVIFEIYDSTVPSSERFPLPDNYGRHYLLPQIWLSFFHSADDHVADASSWQSVQSGTEAFDGDDVQVFSARVVGTVDNGANG